MKRIFLEGSEERRMPRGTFVIDPVPPKSCYRDGNRSDIVASKTFIPPDEKVLKELYATSRTHFKKWFQYKFTDYKGVNF